MDDGDDLGLDGDLRRLGARVRGDVVEDLVAARLFPGIEQPARIGDFIVLDLIGSGGMGTVYAAVADGPDGASDGEKVAIKVVRSDRSDDDGLARLRREADLLARLDHPALVRLRSTGVHEGQLFLVMDFVAGLQLDRWQSVTPRSWRQLLALYLRVGEGLAAAHALGVIHRDFKPANVLVDENDGPKIVDFGLARPLPALRAGSVGIEYSITATGRTSGTPGYTAPELFAGARADPAVDVFSFSVAALEALSRVEGEAAPGALIDVLLRGVTPDPRNRWADMPTLLQRMRTAAPEKGRGWFARLSSSK
ncbi:MAG: serine/threonine protein kinase [Myxococcales bacterium]|nr:serine/threonine protein kinase [Myxococcales bacterium]